MKKILALVLAGTMLFALPACTMTAGNSEVDKISDVQHTIDPAMTLAYNSQETRFLSAGITDTTEGRGEVTEAEIIARDRALEIALENAGLTLESVFDLDVELDREKNGTFWEVDFETTELEYSYYIDSITGEIVGSRTEPQTRSQTKPQKPQTEITKPQQEPPQSIEGRVEVTEAELIARDRALEIALENASLTLESVFDLDVELDKDKNGTFWEVEFETREIEYSYDINATTGEIVKNKTEVND